MFYLPVDKDGCQLHVVSSNLTFVFMSSGEDAVVFISILAGKKFSINFMIFLQNKYNDFAFSSNKKHVIDRQHHKML